MKNNDKYDKVITDFDLDFIKKKFDDDGVTPPVNLESGNIKNAIEKSHNKRIKFTNSKVLETAVSFVACVAIVAVSLNLAFTQSNQKPPVTNDSLQSENAEFDTFSSAKEIKEYFKSIEKNNKSYNFFKDTIKGAETAKDTASLTYSKTNVQVENVDEADIIKNDGKYIYTASSNSENKIRIYKPDGKKVKLMSQIEYNNVDDDENEAFISDIYIYNNSLIAQSYSYDENSWEYTNIDIYSLADIKKPKKYIRFRSRELMYRPVLQTVNFWLYLTDIFRLIYAKRMKIIFRKLK